MPYRLPPLYALRAFEVAARTSSFTQAANELCITQSAISRHIRTLESSLDCKLFDRHGPKLALTESGRLLATQLKAGFKLIEDACAQLQSPRAELRLKAPSTLTMRWLLPGLELLQTAMPDCELKLSSVWMDYDSVDFYAEPFDCAILLGNGRFGDDIIAIRLFDELLLPICSAKQLGAAEWSVADLQSAVLIHPSPDRRDWRRWLAAMDISAQVEIESGTLFDTLDQALTAAINGYGIAMADLALSTQAIRAGLAGLPFKTTLQTGDAYYLVYPQRSNKIAAIEQLQAHLLAQKPDFTDLGINIVATI